MSQAEGVPADVEMGNQTGLSAVLRPNFPQLRTVYCRGLPRLASFRIKSAVASGIQLWRWLWTTL
jgi:hypothetical protein